MSLKAGTRLGHYEILSSLGAGGMGEVYRAKDTKLGREVAIKLLLEEVSRDPERLARFEREAKVLASLNHNNIATLYGFETASIGSEGESPFLVMEVVEGETLAERIKRGAIPVEEALPLFLQIAEGLEAAHEKGVIHRDLKPANIKVLDDGNASAGRVKILDFGLAKAMAVDVAESGDASRSMSPTLTLAATQRGEILGTAAYMSPEQARGLPVDKRADIWAFGVCFLEALGGERVFEGEDASITLASVLKSEPDWERLPDSTPRKLRELLRRCLRKDPRQRLRDIGDARIEIEEAIAAPEADEPTLHAVVAQKRSPVPLALAALAASAVVAAIAAWTLRPDPPNPVLRAVMSAPPSREVVMGISTTDLTITPDGERIVYEVRGDEGSSLYVRPVDQLEGALLGRLGNRAGAPFVSPDGAWVGFFDASDRRLKKISILGGLPVTLSELPGPGVSRGASWGTDETIIFATLNSAGLLRVPAAGGEPESLTTLDPEKGETAHAWPHVLPGGEAVLFTIQKGTEFEIAVLSLETREIRTLLPGGSGPLYASTGHLVYGIDGTLRAVPFDLDRLAVTGDPVPVLQGLVTKGSGAVNFAFSQNGRLVYVAGDALGGASRSLVWVDRGGREEPIDAEPRGYIHPLLSPDGKKVALGILDEETDIWILDLSVGTLSRLTFAAETDQAPVWTPDSERILFGSGRGGSQGIYWKAASGAGSVERLTEDQSAQFPSSVSPDGTRLVYVQTGGTDGSLDLFVLSLEGEPRAEPLLTTEFGEASGEISPDGRWLAYRSDESGNNEIYVRPVPNVDDGRWQISTNGGFQPLWSRDGRELFYRFGPEFFAVPVETEGEFRHGTPEVLFQGGTFFQSAGRTYDVSPDGERFLMITASATSEESSQPDVVLVENWFEELKRIVPSD